MRHGGLQCPDPYNDTPNDRSDQGGLISLILTTMFSQTLLDTMDTL